MRKLSVIVLLVCFSVQITGYHLFFNLLQSNIRKTMQQRILRDPDPSKFEEFSFSFNPDQKSEQPQWLEDNEFRYQGQLYDVVSKKMENGRLIVRCISDKKETELIAHYKNLAQDDFGSPAGKGTITLLKLIQTFFIPEKGFTFYRDLSPSFPISFNSIHPLPVASGDVPTPPPQVS